MLLLVFMGMGVYKLWSRLVPAAWVNWVLLPGTIVSEMAYIFGCLITGGEIRRAKLLVAPRTAGGRRRRGGDSEPTTEATQRFKVLGPLIASLLSIVACGAAIVLVHSLLGEPVIDSFYLVDGLFNVTYLEQSLPTGWAGMWDQLDKQLDMLRRMCETWGEVDWLDWRVPLFVYLAACLSVRLTPVGRDLRFTLSAAVIVVALIAGIGALSTRFTDLVQDVWPLLTYVYATLLFLLAITLTLQGIVLLIRALTGKHAKD
jgi:hypothetical protein